MQLRERLFDELSIALRSHQTSPDGGERGKTGERSEIIERKEIAPGYTSSWTSNFAVRCSNSKIRLMKTREREIEAGKRPSKAAAGFFLSSKGKTGEEVENEKWHGHFYFENRRKMARDLCTFYTYLRTRTIESVGSFRTTNQRI